MSDYENVNMTPDYENVKADYTPTTEEVQFFTFGTWFHRKRGHRQHWRVVSVPMFDMSARGRLVDCSCGKVWAL